MATVCFHAIPEYLELLLLTFCVGASICLLCVFRNPTTLNVSPSDRVWHLLRISTLAMVVISFANLLVRVAEMSGQPFTAVFSLLPMVITRTHLGHVWLIRMAAIVLMSVMANSGKRFRGSLLFLSLMLGIGLVVSMTWSATGHAADSGDFRLPEIIEWLHLLSVLFWGGGLFVLSLTVIPDMAHTGDQAARYMAGTAARFSRIAGIAVAVIALTAIYNVVVYVGSLDALMKALYGRIVIVKTVLFFLLLNLGAINRYVNIPFLRQISGCTETGGDVVGGAFSRCLAPLSRRLKEGRLSLRFENIIRAEALLMALVLLCAVMLRHEVPGRHFLHREHAPGTAGHGHLHRAAGGPEPVVLLETNPSDITAGRPVQMRVRIQWWDGRPLEGLIAHHDRLLHAIIIGSDLTHFAHIHPEDLGPVTGDMLKEAVFPLLFTFPEAGRYLIGLDFATADGLYSKTLHVNIKGQPPMGGQKIDFANEKDFGEYHISLHIAEAGIEAGRETELKYIITRKGRPVTDLEPFLGAPMHLAIVREDLASFIHTHGRIPGTVHNSNHEEIKPSVKFGPEINASVVFPDKGNYKVFSQMKERGRVLLFDFAVKVR